MPPIRTCAGCRRRRPQLELLRFVLPAARLVPDVAGREPGRGVYCCPEIECLGRAAQKGGFARCLRRKVSANLEKLLAEVRRALQQAESQLRWQMIADGRIGGQRPVDAPLGHGLKRLARGSGWERLARWAHWSNTLAGEMKDRSSRSE